MTKEEILSMAKEAGMKASIGKTDKQGNYHPNVNALFSSVPIEWLERFADLVAEKQRKECAKVLTENAAQCTKGSMNEYILTSNAQAILVRGDK